MQRHEDRYWTQETVVAALRAAAEILGRPPAVVDVVRSPSIRAKMTAARLAEAAVLDDAIEAGEIRVPPIVIVKRECGSWSNALALAGFPRVMGGAPTHRRVRVA
jgi:hypothetical protein